jgi:hypothetical protein
VALSQYAANAVPARGKLATFSTAGMLPEMQVDRGEPHTLLLFVARFSAFVRNANWSYSYTSTGCEFMTKLGLAGGKLRDALGSSL